MSFRRSSTTRLQPCRRRPRSVRGRRRVPVLDSRTVRLIREETEGRVHADPPFDNPVGQLGAGSQMTDSPSQPIHVPVLEMRGDDQALSGRARQRRHRPGRPARRDPRAPRRERRRQVHAHEHPLRAGQPGRGRDLLDGERSPSTGPRTPSPAASAWSTSTSCWSRSCRSPKRPARRRADGGAGLPGPHRRPSPDP